MYKFNSEDIKMLKYRKGIILLFSLCIWSFIIYSCQSRSPNATNENFGRNNNIDYSQQTLIAHDSLGAKAAITTPNRDSKGNIKNLNFGCGYSHKVSSNSLELYYPSDREIEEINNITSYTGLPMNFDIYAANINNAIATTVDDRRIILYDRDLFGFADHMSKNYWASMSILAHEIGHHLSGHTLKRKGSSLANELEADKFSGFILYKMGASKEQSTIAIKIFGSELPTETHPSKYARIKAIEEGWLEAAVLRYEGAVPPPPARRIPEIEYTTKMLYGTETFMDDDIPIENSRLFVGTITEVDTEFNGGGIEIFTEKSLDNREDDFFVKKKEMFMAPLNMSLGTAFENGMSRAEWSWYDEVFRPGRKIQFRYVAVGSGGFLYLTYVKVVR